MRMDERTVITPYPDGPLIVRGPAAIAARAADAAEAELSMATGSDGYLRAHG